MKVPSFDSAKILVVGDVMLDSYWHGNVSRISPEAPVPIVHVQQIEERIGGAGNVALNISTLGASAKLLGLVGNDAASQFIEKNLENNGVKNCLLHAPGISTINKLRVIGHSQQLVRLDFEKHFTEWDDEPFFASYIAELSDCNLVILSDYGKGTLRRSAKLIELAREMDKTILVDPKSRDFSIYRGATVVTPNMSEFEAVVGHCKDEDEIEAKGRELLCKYEFQAILITRGASGMSLICKGRDAYHLPAQAREIYDVTGAGDTVIATLGAAVASGEDLFEAMVLANVAAGEAVKRLGAAAISIADLRFAMRQRQQDVSSVAILDEEHLLHYVQDARARGEKIVMTNGCFDILHSGHVMCLEKAKSFGQRLIVAVNSDDSVVRLKGDGRPVNSVQDRMLVLAALGAVDWVVPFSDDTPERLIKLISPDFLVKGGDYKVHEIAGSDHVLSYGGKVEIVPIEEGFSTTSILEKIKGSD